MFLEDKKEVNKAKIAPIKVPMIVTWIVISNKRNPCIQRFPL